MTGSEIPGVKDGSAKTLIVETDTEHLEHMDITIYISFLPLSGWECLLDHRSSFSFPLSSRSPIVWNPLALTYYKKKKRERDTLPRDLFLEFV